MSTLSGLLAAALLHASVASVVAVEGDVRVTATDASAARSTKAGDAIGEKDLVLVPERGSVTLKLADGTQATFEGKKVIAGRRLAAAKRAAFAQLAARSVDLVTHELETAGASTAMAIRGNEDPGDPAEAGRPRRDVSFLGDDARSGRTPDVEVAEFSLRKGDLAVAEKRAQAVLESAASERDERRRAYRVLAFVALANEDPMGGAGHLDRALADSSPADGRAVLDALRVERARVRVLLGDDAGAQADLRTVLEPGGPASRRMEAHFLLGILALGAGDTKGAKKEFALLENAPELEEAAGEALEAAKQNKKKN